MYSRFTIDKKVNTHTPKSDDSTHNSNQTRSSAQATQENQQNNSSAEPPRKKRKIDTDSWIYKYLKGDEIKEYDQLKDSIKKGPSLDELTRFQTLARNASARRQRLTKRLSMEEQNNGNGQAKQASDQNLPKQQINKNNEQMLHNMKQQVILQDSQTKRIEELLRQIEYLKAENREIAQMISRLSAACDYYAQMREQQLPGTSVYSSLPNSSPMFFQYRQPVGQSATQLNVGTSSPLNTDSTQNNLNYDEYYLQQQQPPLYGQQVVQSATQLNVGTPSPLNTDSTQNNLDYDDNLWQQFLI